MICVLCKLSEVDQLWDDGKGTSASLYVACSTCRRDNIPKHIPPAQYIRYWQTYSKKWREQNDLCNL